MRRSCLVQILGMLIILVAFVGGCSGGSGSGSQTAPVITQQPVSATVTIGQTATFSVTATSSTTPSYQWQRNSTNISGAIGASYTTPSTASGDSGAKFDVVVTNQYGSTTSTTAALTVTAAAPNTTDIVTYHCDNTRSGVNANETILTTANVNSTSFGKLGEFAVDGQIDGQILYLNQVSIPGSGVKNVVYAATEMDSVYAFDAESVSGTTSTFLWKASLIPSGEVPATSLPCGNIPKNGVTATPVIDRGRNAIYIVAMTQDANKNIIHRIHALDLSTGAELFGGPTVITATYPGTGGNSSNGTVTFLPSVHHDRAALLESDGVIYTAWSGFYGDCGSYSAWVIAYNADTLAQAGAIDLVPDNHGGGMWMGGGGPAADAAGNVYVISGNGFGDTPGINHSYGNSLVKLSPPSSGSFGVADYFTPYNTISEDNGDADFGSAGPLLLPDMVDVNGVTQHLAIGAGKDGNMYVVNRDNMGEFNAMQNEIHQEIQISNQENHSSPVFFNGTVYVGPTSTKLQAYTMSNAMLPTTPTSASAHTFGGNGTVPSISASGTSNGIIWLVDNTYQGGSLFALSASNLANELYDSTQAPGNRDKPSSVSGHFITPTIANGKVFFGTGSTVAVYGLLVP